MEVKTVSCYYLPFNKNFGDLLSPLILGAYGLPIRQLCVSKGAEMMGIGSLLSDLPPRYTGSVWTSGFLWSDRKVHLLDKRVKIWAVRGRESLNRLSGALDKDQVVLGDGGLIADKWYCPRSIPKRYKLGIVPHYIDFETVRDNVRAIHRPDVHLINVLGDARNFVNQLFECEHIVSSSLHGLIVSDCYGIPNAPFRVSTTDRLAGKDFKFHDYYSVFGMRKPATITLRPDTELEPILSHVSTNNNRPNIDSVKFNIDQVTTRMVEYYKPK